MDVKGHVRDQEIFHEARLANPVAAVGTAALSRLVNRCAGVHPKEHRI